MLEKLVLLICERLLCNFACTSSAFSVVFIKQGSYFSLKLEYIKY